MRPIEFTVYIIILISIVGCHISRAQHIDSLRSQRREISRVDTFLLVKNGIVSDTTKTTLADWERKMPWIAVLVIGVLAFLANIVSSINLRRTSLETTKQQIELSRKNSERDFNKTVLSGNRQIWITQFRSLMSEIITLLSFFVTKQGLNNEDYSKLQLLVTQAELMLTDSTDERFTEILINAKVYCFELLKTNCQAEELELHIKAVKTATISKLNTEWDKVRSGK
ncbi:MAG: hypothetical protein Q8S11_01515 [Daejeonella sp.]|uniref:hypothetical protein n=1 Tax=Daejeonella sp. TaxID=2805397 RepID=UPI002733675D|nr:hypothetical protein [Daejeonella sp.]MDP3466979.1 hypothetical protein [Daejeonella sp.]